MGIIHRLEDMSPELSGQVVAIGNFDGIHLGHHFILEQAKRIAEDLGKDLIILTFEPHPRALFRPDDPPFRITPLALKYEKLKKCGVASVVALTFDWDFASQSAEKFIKHILRENLDAAHIVVGKDFCFGQLRKGTPEMIQNAGLETTIINPVTGGHSQKYSSSTIRALLRAGDIDQANAQLGWEWEMRGTIMRGDQRGRELGYPTANVPLGETLHPAYGIYAAWVQIEAESKWWPSATNIGIRPMFELKEGQVEAHILDGFDRDIYDKHLRIKPVKRLRGEAKFDSLDALITQMEKDCSQSLKVLQIA